MALTKKVIGLNSVDGARLLLDNDQAVRSKNASGVAVDVMKVDATNKLQLLIAPEVSADAASANQLVRKSQFDTGISGVSGAIGALETEFDNFVATKAQPGGLASLDSNGKLPSAQVPAIAITDVFVVANIAARDALSGVEEGDVAKVTNAGSGLPKTYIHDGTNWIEIESGSDVDTVNGYTGSVLLATSDIAESGVTNLYYTPTRKAAIEAYADQAEADAITSANSYTSGQISGLQTTLAAEDLTFLKKDGSRAMTGALAMGSNKITGLADATAAGDAVNKGQLDGVQTALAGDISSEAGARIAGDAATLASAQAYTNGQLDLLTVQELGYEAKTLSAGDVSARQVTLAASVVGTPWIMLDNVLLKPVVDFTVSGAVVSWPSDVPSLVGEELVAGDVLHVWYHKSAQPFV